MRRVIGGGLLGVVAWISMPAPVLAHGGHTGGHEGLFGVFHPIFEGGHASMAVVLVGLVAGAAVVLARVRSRT